MKRFPALRDAVLCLAASLLLLPAGWVGATNIEYSMIMGKAASSLLLDIATAGDRLVAVGERGHILYSDDGGLQWTQVQVPTTAMLTRVFFVDDELGWAVGHDGNVMHSRDGGITWELQRDGVADQVSINEERAGRALTRVKDLRAELELADEELAVELSEALDEAQWALDNAREVLDAPVYAPPLMDVWFATAEQGWAAGAYGVLLHTSNGGRNWADWSHKLDNPEELHLNGVAGDAQGNLFLASEWGAVFVSGNAGESWRQSETGYDGSFFGVVVNPATGSVFAYGLLGTIYRSADAGETWEESTSEVSASLFGAATNSGAVVFVGQGGTATVSHDDGETFAPLIQPRRNGLYGVTPYGEKFVATGEGGSLSISAVAGGAGQ
jgi:photosystem II stability/assembly factor-like uncharacterized protein